MILGWPLAGNCLVACSLLESQLGNTWVFIGRRLVAT
jgi:hypothetical protein